MATRLEKKEDLAYEVTTGLITHWNEVFRTCYGTLNGNGVERLEQFLLGLIGYMSERINITEATMSNVMCCMYEVY